MPFSVQELIEENPKVIVARPDEPVQTVLARMFENNFSQLPVVDSTQQPTGMITSESILRALNNFEVSLDRLKVEHASTKADTFRSDADLFELLDRLQDTYAVLIVDGEKRLKGIVTNYDTAEYFRRRAEDMMLVEDIETMIKDYIQAAYQTEPGQIDEETLDKTAQMMTDTGQSLRNSFERALIHYLTLQAEAGQQTTPNAEWLETVMEKHLTDSRPTRTFEDLSLSEYIDLLLKKEHWTRYEPTFGMERSAIRNLLNKVRLTRNALAHFRSDITRAERDRLRFAADWLARYQDAIMAAFIEESNDEKEESIALETELTKTELSSEIDETEIILPVEDEAEPGESRYAPLAIWLQNQPTRKNLVKPTFSQIEEIIEGELPASAYEHRAWWANDSVSHVQSKQWLEVGWRVASVNMTTQVVRFARIKERQKAYIDFYSELIAKLKEHPGYDYLQIMPDGSSWYWTKSAYAGEQPQVAAFNFAFGRGNVFRIELYIDYGEKEINKPLFDMLHAQKEAIESELGCELRWQRLNKRRASRIACILPGNIMDDEETLAQLQAKAIPTMIDFTNVIYPRVVEIGQEILTRQNGDE